jgi:hypothetical protein
VPADLQQATFTVVAQLNDTRSNILIQFFKNAPADSPLRTNLLTGLAASTTIGQCSAVTGLVFNETADAQLLLVIQTMLSLTVPCRGLAWQLLFTAAPYIVAQDGCRSV